VSKPKNDEYQIHNYARPRGLRSATRRKVESEAEEFYQGRYSEKMMEDMNLNNRNTVLGRTSNLGMKGSQIRNVVMGTHEDPDGIQILKSIKSTQKIKKPKYQRTGIMGNPGKRRR